MIDWVGWPKNGLIALAVHERTRVHFLVLPDAGSLLSTTEITEYTYFSPLRVDLNPLKKKFTKS